MKLLLTAKASAHVCGNDCGEPSLEARFLRMGRGFKARQLKNAIRCWLEVNILVFFGESVSAVGLRLIYGIYFHLDGV